MQGVYHLSNLLSGTHGLLGQILHLYMGLITSCLLFPFFPMPNVSVHLIPRLSMGNVKKEIILNPFLFSLLKQ